MRKRVILLILDSLGIGYMDDVKQVRPQDEGANTFYHILDQAGKIEIPNLEKLGIGKLVRHPRLKGPHHSIASYGILNLQHDGADSYAGHQEIMGAKPKKPLIEPFADRMENIKKVLEANGYQVSIPDPGKRYLLVNGLVIVADNIETDRGQVYNVTAPLDEIRFDEVLQVAKVVRATARVSRVIALGGEDVKLYHILDCIEAREDGRVGVNSPKSQVYKKGYQSRHLGYGVDPDKQIGSLLIKGGKEVKLIGKMQDVIQCEGAGKIPAVDTEMVISELIRSMDEVDEGLIAATVQETDLAGHAEDVERYAEKIMIVDRYLDTILEKMTEDDLLMISADHGNDPTIGHSRHTREKTFLLVYGKSYKSRDIGERKTLSDIAATIADFFRVELPENGASFFSVLEDMDKAL